MKPLQDYPTPLTDVESAKQRAVLDAACASGKWECDTIALREDFSRDLERRLALCREFIDKVWRSDWRYLESMDIHDDAAEILKATKP